VTEKPPSNLGSTQEDRILSPQATERNPEQQDLFELLNRIDDSDEDGAKVLGMLVQTVLRAGPLPPPRDLADYEKALPGSADRILAMAEKEQDRRLARADRQIDADIRDSGRGVVYAFILGMTCIIGGIIALIMGATAGAFISLAGLATLAGTFIYGTRRKAQRPQPKPRVPGPKGEN
jgi:uncharacterized membrane protein